ncbi:acyl-CoA N-acyltransferase [Glonium stellatum]|uniref:Acyl-CoA N-acyltransferase n=1 Tax=Glonium stellatum TaxID=574774 RepID=A0A8E2JZZ0_9PEZI|nr:acyl-CoA N-acyltransferase [Glonium stellatum]
MSLEISPMVEVDVATYVRIRHEAFKNTIDRIFYTRELSSESKDKISDGILEALRNDKHTHYLKVTDTATGEIVACAKWKIFDCERTSQELETELELPEPLPESDVPAWTAFFTDLSDARREIMGTRPYFQVLDLLVTHADHHRRGAGSMLITWGTAQADEMGLDAYLEASEMGKPLYERHGFEDVKLLHFDLSRFGGKGDFRHMVSMS